MSVISAPPPRNKRKPPTSFSLYDGRELLGTVASDHGAFIAINLDGEIIGKFSTLTEATRSLSPAADGASS
jgi:hypothetical protein